MQSESPLLQRTNASVAQTITQKQIENLPVAGRNPLAFASLSAGVTPQAFNRGTQFGAAGSSRSQYITVEGGRDSSTNYAIDGVYVRSLRFNNLSLNPPLDAVQEVSVLRNSFSTEYGQGQAVVSIVTKSGTQQLTRLRVRLSPRRRLRQRRISSARSRATGHKRGVTGGGPIVKNRFFVFGGYEGTANDAGADVARRACRARRCCRGTSPALATAISDPLTGPAVSGQHHPASRFSNFAKTLAPTVPAPNNPGANNYTSGQDLQRRRGYRDVRARPGAQQQPQPVRAVHVLQRHRS